MRAPMSTITLYNQPGESAKRYLSFVRLQSNTILCALALCQERVELRVKGRHAVPLLGEGLLNTPQPILRNDMHREMVEQ